MKLAAYMQVAKIGPEEMAQLVGNASASGVIKWMREERTPRPDQQRRIYEVTAGAVTPNDFVLEPRTKPTPSETGETLNA